MKTIKEVFGQSVTIIKLREDRGPAYPEVIYSIDRRGQYSMPRQNFIRIMQEYGVNCENELRHVPMESIDTRPLWKKDLDFRMGKKVDFKPPMHYPQMAYEALRVELNGIVKRNACT